MIARSGLTIAVIVSLIPVFGTLGGMAEDLPPEILLVAHTLQANGKMLKRLPQYTCLETISRSRPSRKGHKSEKQDVIQLDVGVGAHEELYSWPGDAAFSSKDVAALVGHGMLASGLFHSFAANLFVGDAGLVKAAGTSVVNGKKADRFTFSIPSLHKTWTVNWLGARGLVGEEGEFWVDESDLTLLRLDVTATDIPANIPLQSMKVTIQYRTLPSGEGRVLIPEEAGLKALEWNGTLNQEAVDFSHCRAFEAESSLVPTGSTAEDLTKTVARYEAQREVLPGGLLFSIQLETPVKAGKTIVGDPITAVLESPVKTRTQEVIPKGAVLAGRVRRFESVDNPANSFILGLEFDEVTWPGHLAAFFGSLFSTQPLLGLDSSVTATEHVESVFSGVMHGDRTTVETVVPAAIPGVASFFLKGTATGLPKGFRMSWRTEEVKPRSEIEKK